MALVSKPDTWTVIIPILVMLFGVSLIFPNAYACVMTPFAKTAGMAGALTTFLQRLGGVLTSGLIAYSPDQSALPMGIAIVGASILTLIAFKFRDPGI